MKNPILYIVINKDLGMSAGKAAAQAVHAAKMMSANSTADFLSDYRRTVIVLQAKGEQIRNLYVYLEDTDVEADYYIDEGYNEVDAYSITALAAGPIEHDNMELRGIFEAFDLFSVSGDVHEDAVKALQKVQVEHFRYDDFTRHDTTPRFLRKTIKWLNKQ